LPSSLSSVDLRRIFEQVREELTGGGTESASSSLH
jgi:hypothetical protein